MNYKKNKTYRDLPPLYNALVLTHSSGELPHLPNTCTPNHNAGTFLIYYERK